MAGRTVRDRGVARAARIAFQQQEERDLAYALLLVRRYEKKLQRKEERKSRKRVSRKRFPTLLHKATESTKDDRNDISNFIEDIKYRLQASLTRYLLKKESLASFRLRTARDEFISLFKGFVDIRASSDGETLQAIINGDSTQNVTDKWGKMLGVGGGLSNWVIRRLYGNDTNKKRDCSYLSIDLSLNHKKQIVCTLKTLRKKQIDITGVEREVTTQMMVVRFPRNCVNVRTQSNGKRLMKAKKR